MAAPMHAHPNNDPSACFVYFFPPIVKLRATSGGAPGAGGLVFQAYSLQYNGSIIGQLRIDQSWYRAEYLSRK